VHDFFPIQSGPPFWSWRVHRTDLVRIRPISRDLPSNPLPTPPARPPRHRPCVPRLPPGGTLDGRRAQAGAGRLPCPRPPPTGQFRVCPKLSPANWPVWGCPKIWVCPKRPARRPSAAPRPRAPVWAPPSAPKAPRPADRGPAPGPGPSWSRYISGQGTGRTPSRLGPILPDIYLCSWPPPAGSTPRPPHAPARLPGRRATARGLRGRGPPPRTHRQRVSLGCVQTNPTNWPIRVCPKRPGIRVRVPPSGPWPRPRNQLASPGSARGHAPRRPIRPPTPAGNWPAATPPRGTAHLGCPTGTAAPPPPRLEGCRHGGRARRRQRRGNPRTRPPSGLPLGPGRHACLFHCPPARYAAPDPPPQSTPQPGTAGPVASRLSVYSPAPLGRENGGQPLKCTESFPGDPLNYVSGPCAIFFPMQSGPPFWSGGVHRTDLVRIRPISRGLPGQQGVFQSWSKLDLGKSARAGA